MVVFMIFLGCIWFCAALVWIIKCAGDGDEPSVCIAWSVFLPITLLIFIVKNGIKGIIDVCKGE